MEESGLYAIKMESELVSWDNGKLGLAIQVLCVSAYDHTPVKYFVVTLDKKQNFEIPVGDVTFVPAAERQKQIEASRKGTGKQTRRKVVTEKVQEPERPPAPEGAGLAAYLAMIDVGKHDTALSYIVAVVVRARVERGVEFSGDNVGILFDQYVEWADRNELPIAGIDPSNLLARVEGELFHIEGDRLHKQTPFGSPKKEADAINSGFLKASSVPKAVPDEYIGSYAYHTTSFINLYLIAQNGLRRDFGGTPGGSCYLAEKAAQRDNSIQHSKQTIAAGLTRQVMNTYGNQREDRADEIVADDAMAHKKNPTAPQSDLDERGVLLRFKIKATHLWVIDPQDARAVLLKNSDVLAAELECLTDSGWVGLNQLTALGQALGDLSPLGGEAFQVFVRQSDRVLWRLDNEPLDNDILEGRAFIERGFALAAELATDSTEYAQISAIINQLTDRLSLLREPAREEKKD